jgi:hypothetical protein
MLTMLVGVIFFSSLMSKVANFIDKMNPQAKMQDERMEELKLFLGGLTLPRHAKTKITVRNFQNQFQTFIFTEFFCLFRLHINIILPIRLLLMIFQKRLLNLY